LFVLLDNVQYKKRNFQNRTRYSTATGHKLLSLPVKCKSVQLNKTAIHHIELADKYALMKHYKTLSHRYGKTPGWLRIKEQLHGIYSQKTTHLTHINRDLLDLTLESYQIKTPIINASDMAVSGHKNELIISILKEVNADLYISGNGAKAYMDHSLFQDANIKVEYQSFHHPEYDQKINSQFYSACFALEWFFLEPENAIGHFSSVKNEI
jgi:hypothetical protein